MLALRFGSGQSNNMFYGISAFFKHNFCLAPQRNINWLRWMYFFLYFPTKIFEFSFNTRCKLECLRGHLDRVFICATQLASSLFLKMLKYFEVMLNIFEFSHVKEIVESWLVYVNNFCWINRSCFFTETIKNVSASFLFLLFRILMREK